MVICTALTAHSSGLLLNNGMASVGSLKRDLKLDEREGGEEGKRICLNRYPQPKEASSTLYNLSDTLILESTHHRPRPIQGITMPQPTSRDPLWATFKEPGRRIRQNS